MSDRRFKYKRPTRSAERIEAIYEEVSSSSRGGGVGREPPPDSLKDYVVAILANLKSEAGHRKLAKDGENYSIQFALFALALVSVVFLVNGWSRPSDWQWLNEHRFALRLWGIAFAAVYLGVSIERSSMFRRLWSFGFTKLAASVAVSALFIFSTGKASAIINGVFGLDASALPFTRAYLSGILAFQYSAPLLVVVAAFAIAHAFDVVGFVRSKFSDAVDYDFPPWHSIVFLILAIVFLFFSWQWINDDFSESKLPAKVYRLAHLLDFNSTHHCANIPQGVSVIFVGPDQSRVLVDRSAVETADVEAFVKGGVIEQVAGANAFDLLPCEVVRALP